MRCEFFSSSNLLEICRKYKKEQPFTSKRLEQDISRSERTLTIEQRWLNMYHLPLTFAKHLQVFLLTKSHSNFHFHLETWFGVWMVNLNVLQLKICSILEFSFGGNDYFLHAVSVNKRVTLPTNWSLPCDAGEVIFNSGKGHRIDFAVIQRVRFWNWIWKTYQRRFYFWTNF